MSEVAGQPGPKSIAIRQSLSALEIRAAEDLATGHLVVLLVSHPYSLSRTRRL